jgi:hypothetical protein
MFQRNEKKIIPVQTIIAQNPFASRSNEVIGRSIAELKDISAKLRIVALNHCEMAQNKPSNRDLSLTYKTMSALILCHYCQSQISAVVDKRSAKREDSKWSPMYDSFAASCREIVENTNAATRYVSNAIDQYKTMYPRGTVPAITRIAGASTVTALSWGMSTALWQQNHPWMPKIVTAVVAIIAVSLSVSDKFIDSKNMLRRHPKETPYSVYVERRIGQILLGANDDTKKDATRPAKRESVLVKKDKALAR